MVKLALSKVWVTSGTNHGNKMVNMTKYKNLGNPTQYVINFDVEVLTFLSSNSATNVKMVLELGAL